MYLGSMLRSTVALHNLINNKMKNKKEKAFDSGKNMDSDRMSMDFNDFNCLRCFRGGNSMDPGGL